jgi:L-amino acid N-acyltransferase
MEIRDASVADLPAVLAIYNEIIATTTAIYAEQPLTLDNRRSWFENRRQSGFPVLAAFDERGLAGFASFGEWRSWPCGYDGAVEHSVYVRADARGKGFGSALMAELLRRAAAMSKHVMIGAIDAENIASLDFHERLGFEKVGRFREVAHKFDRWLDLVFVQRILD